MVLVSGIYGCDLLTGGAKALATVAANVLRYATLNSVGGFVLFMSKMTVVLLVLLSALHILQVSYLGVNNFETNFVFNMYIITPLFDTVYVLVLTIGSD